MPAQRWPSKVGPQLMKTYSIRRPVDTHTRPASCAEVECEAWTHGYTVTVDEATDLGVAQAGYIRSTAVKDGIHAPGATQAGQRRYSERRDGALTLFDFPPGTQCMGGEHRVELDRPELYIVRGGDWRTPLAAARRHASAEHWLEDFGGHQERLADRIRKG